MFQLLYLLYFERKSYNKLDLCSKFYCTLDFPSHHYSTKPPDVAHLCIATLISRSLFKTPLFMGMGDRHETEACMATSGLMEAVR